MKTKVLFRMFNSEVLALFTQEAAVADHPEMCQSYALIGQHSAASCAGVIRASRPATHDEWRDLYCELRRIGYELTIAKRCTRQDELMRKKQAAGKVVAS